MRFNPAVAEFWDREALDKEMYRQIQVCHDCRLCFNLCPVFPDMFNRIDTRGDTVDNLTPADFDHLADYCYQCKLCFEKCPFTPPHNLEVDIPRLFLRDQAVRAHQGHSTLGERLAADTDLLGRFATPLAPLANWINRNRLWRTRVMKPLLGIHPDRRLPEYHLRTFLSWFKRRPKPAIAEPVGKVALFASCMVNYNSPHIGRATVEVLEHNGIAVVCPPQVCCGMPFMGKGVGRAADNARKNIAAFRPWLEQGYEIVTPEPACAWMLTREYPALLETEEAKAFASKVKDLGHYLLGLARGRKLNRDFKQGLGKVAYHFSCNSRALEIGEGSRDLLALIPGTEVESIARCSGMDGTWGMKTEWFEESFAIGSRLFQRITESDCRYCASDCSMAARQIEQALDRERPAHPIELVHRAYGLGDGERSGGLGDEAGAAVWLGGQLRARRSLYFGAAALAAAGFLAGLALLARSSRKQG